MAIVRRWRWAPRCPSAPSPSARRRACTPSPRARRSSATRSATSPRPRALRAAASSRWPSPPSRHAPRPTPPPPPRRAPARKRRRPSRPPTSRRRASTSPTSSRPTARRSSRSSARRSTRSRRPAPARRGSSGRWRSAAPGGDLLLHGQRLLVIQTREPAARRARAGGAARLEIARGPEPDAHHRGRRRRPGRPEGRAHADPRRPVRQRAPERRDRPRRALLDAARLRGARRAPPRVGLAAALALRLADLRPPSHAEDRRVPRGAPPAVVLGARDGLDPHHRPRQGPVGGRRRRGHDRRADGLRLGRPPLRRHPALDRSADAARRPADDLDADPPLRRQRPRPHHLRGQRRGPGLPAQPVLALRAGRRPARGLDQRAGLVAGRAAGRRRAT